MKIEIEVPDGVPLEEAQDAAQGAVNVLWKKSTDPEPRPSGDLWGLYLKAKVDRPYLYTRFKNLAQELRDEYNFPSFGASAIVEGMRWKALLTDTGPMEDVRNAFKITNGLGAYWARQLVEERPDFVTFFEWRDSAADAYFPKAAGIIAAHRAEKGSDEPDEPEATPEGPEPGPNTPQSPAPTRVHDGQAYYDRHIAPFVQRFGTGNSAV